jgi:hypothetical protein
LCSLFSPYSLIYGREIVRSHKFHPFKLFCSLSSNKDVDANHYTILLPLEPPDGAELLTPMLSDLIAHNISSENNE